MIIQGHEITNQLNLKTHSVVVGSGAGGGVAAFHLAEAGVDTILLEEGGYFQARDFTQREDEMIAKLSLSGATENPGWDDHGLAGFRFWRDDTDQYV